MFLKMFKSLTLTGRVGMGDRERERERKCEGKRDGGVIEKRGRDGEGEDEKWSEGSREVAREKHNE